MMLLFSVDEKFCVIFAHLLICGLLLFPQQSCTAVVPVSALNPAGHVAHTDAPLAF
jgi:hypothetical protein